MACMVRREIYGCTELTKELLGANLHLVEVIGEVGVCPRLRPGDNNESGDSGERGADVVDGGRECVALIHALALCLLERFLLPHELTLERRLPRPRPPQCPCHEEARHSLGDREQAHDRDHGHPYLVKHGLLLPHQPESLKKKEMILSDDVSTTLLRQTTNLKFSSMLRPW